MLRVSIYTVPGLNVVEEAGPSISQGGLEVLEKFDDKPKTAEIRKDCERELTCVQIAKVKISNKLLNFGEVCERHRSLSRFTIFYHSIIFHHIHVPFLSITNLLYPYSAHKDGLYLSRSS